MTNHIEQTTSTVSASPSEGLLGQKYAFATASLLMGIACFINLLGMEKAILAITFGILALRGPQMVLRRKWAIAGIGLGIAMIIAISIMILLYHQELAALIAYLKKFN